MLVLISYLKKKNLKIKWKKKIFTEHDYIIPGGSVVKNPPANAEDAEDKGDANLILRSGRSPGEGNGNPFQYSCLGKPMDKEAWQATVHGVTKTQT